MKQVAGIKFQIRLLVICNLLFVSCKSKQFNSTQVIEKPDISNQPSNSLKAIGIVSYQYKSSGCGTLILCKREIEKDTLFLIPMASIGEYDKDGLEIFFNYRILRIHNPKGCKGTPVQVSDIKVK